MVPISRSQRSVTIFLFPTFIIQLASHRNAAWQRVRPPDSSTFSFPTHACKTWLIIIICNYTSLFCSTTFAIDSVLIREQDFHLPIAPQKRTSPFTRLATSVRWRLYYAPPLPTPPQTRPITVIYSKLELHARLQSNTAVLARNESPCLFLSKKRDIVSDWTRNNISNLNYSIRQVDLPSGAAILSFKIVGTSLWPVMGLINGLAVAGRP